jgi:two-component system, NarL family, sensor histidine kinase DesK
MPPEAGKPRLDRMETDRPTWSSRLWLIATAALVGLVLLLLAGGGRGPAAVMLPIVVAGLAAAVTVWALIRTRSRRKQYEEKLAAWAAERATQAERLHLARDLHDLVSHGLGLITVRAAAARRTTGPEGETERADALADIEQVSRETTTELRRMLTVLRTPGPAPLRPAVTLDDLPAIVNAAKAAGLMATLGVDDLGEVSPGVQLTVCAVIREALNNTVRHAGLTRASVGVRRDGEVIVVDVNDAGPRQPWQPQPGAGHGLDGLRERVTALGGTVSAVAGEHGFQLLARIPDRDHP